MGLWVKHHHAHSRGYGHRADEAAKSDAAKARAHVHSNYESFPRRLDVLVWRRYMKQKLHVLSTSVPLRCVYLTLGSLGRVLYCELIVVCVFVLTEKHLQKAESSA